MKKIFSTIIISLIFFSALTSAQSPTAASPASATDSIAQCIINHHCAPEDINCRAICAQVPNPSNQDANATNACVAGCQSSANDSEAYKKCTSNCISQYYSNPTSNPQGPVVVSPTQTNPSAPSDKVGFENKYLEGTYVAVFVHLIIWVTLLLFSEFIRKRHILPSNLRLEPNVAPITTQDFATADQMDNRYAKATNAARDSLLMLIIATIMTQAGYGATAASIILSWVFVALSIFWVLSILFFDHMWVPLILQAISFPFILAILALAFRTSEKGNPLLPQRPHAKVIGYNNLGSYW
ncbi:8226_t:CDS:2 [Cetraspora pellucida]|uniref:8226_t:CDS:1 n=1 Tax=Cetraspora pellucida TaxID=1433469 RepID=A0A9N9GDD8_9GLOM|nr:8226_t:CDS:2 [Cetraspora pellucida]